MNQIRIKECRSKINLKWILRKGKIATTTKNDGREF
jgi:hypothetical protein